MRLSRFIKDIKPYLNPDDKPYNRELFNDLKDFLHKYGQITDRQAKNWTYPKNRLYE